VVRSRQYPFGMSPCFHRHAIFLWVLCAGCCYRSICPKLLLLPTVSAHHGNNTGASVYAI
jgi:hypothetical protein